MWIIPWSKIKDVCLLLVSEDAWRTQAAVVRFVCGSNSGGQCASTSRWMGHKNKGWGGGEVSALRLFSGRWAAYVC